MSKVEISQVNNLGFLCLLQGKAGDSMHINDDNDGAGSPLFTFVDENIFKKETFLGKCSKGNVEGELYCTSATSF